MRHIRTSLAALVVLGGCMDGTGPRPRPGGEVVVPPSQSAVLVWYETVPRVVAPGQTDSIRIDVTVAGVPDAVTVELRNGTLVTLKRAGTTNVYSARIGTGPLLFAYHLGDLHVAGGFIHVTLGTHSDETNLLVNVKDATVPTVNPQAIAPGVQAADHVVNIRYDTLYLGARVPVTVMKTFYASYPDDYTFAAVVEQVQSPHNTFLTNVRNRVSGLGMAQLDDGRTFGSDSALEAIIHYPVDSFFDLAETSNIHELSHRWMSYLHQPLLAAASPHWPLSDLASGVMGWSDPVTHAALAFPFALVPQPNGTWTLQFNDRPRTFNDLELYLAGLLPADSVIAHIVFRNQNQAGQIRVNGVLQGPVDTVRISDIIARDGPRIPAAGAARKQFRVATIVLSKGGLLTRDELSFFDHMAARGELTTGVSYNSGVASGTTLPFFVASGGRGSLSTRVQAALK